MEWSIFNKKQLLQDLVRFGLNPAEWSLKSTLAGHKQPQVLTNKKDQSFRLLGIPAAQKEKVRWIGIQILSI